MRAAIRQALLAPQRYSPRQGVDRFAGAVVANGGTVGTARYELLATLIEKSMVCGHWWETDDIANLVAENVGQQAVTLKRCTVMTAVGSFAFVADEGQAFNGTTQYYNSLFQPSQHSRRRPDAYRLGVYERTNVGTLTTAMGYNSGTSTSVGFLFPRQSTDIIRAGISSGAVNLPDTITDSRGLTTVSRNGTGVLTPYKNGVAGTTGTTANAPGAFAGGTIFIGCGQNGSGTASGFRASTIGCAEWGGWLTPEQEAAWYAALQAFMTAVGANV